MSQSSCSSESDDLEDYYVDINLYDDVQEVLYAGFYKSIEFFKQTYPDETCNFSNQDEIEEMDVSLSISLKILKNIVIDAWGLLRDLPLMIRLKMDFPIYSKIKAMPKIYVYQISDGKNSSVFAQIKSIVQDFCQNHLQDDKFTSIERNYESLSGASGGGDPSISSRHPKQVPNTSKGFFVQLYLYVQHRLLSLHEFCPICDDRHGDFKATSMIKPVFCEKPLCIFSSQTLGVMANVSETVCLQPEVVSLLICVTTSAVLSDRFMITMQPFIEIALLVPNYEESGYVKQDERAILLKTLDKMPLTASMVSTSESDLKENLSLHHDLCYPLLRWIISSNRSHIIALPKDKQLDFMCTDHQFLLRNSPPIADDNFRTLAKKYGSIFAFHGSPLDNWHSILRQGLVVASGTERQLNGAVHGKGIYLCPKLQTALNYCVLRKPVINVQTKDQYTGLQNCLALCEVINTPQLKKKEEIWICPQSKYVCTRFIFGFNCLVLLKAPVDVRQMDHIIKIRAVLND